MLNTKVKFVTQGHWIMVKVINVTLTYALEILFLNTLT